MTNKLNADKQISIIGGLVEGSSIRSLERQTGIHRDTIMRLGVRVGQACQELHDKKMCELSCEDIQVDEIWGYIGKKQKNVSPLDNSGEMGDAYTFVAIDADTKLVPSYHVGKRDARHAHVFINDLASRVTNRIQLSSDGLAAYIGAVEQAFGVNVDYGQIVKTYSTAELTSQTRYSPSVMIGIEKASIIGRPNMDNVSTSYIERQNLTMRMHCRRLTRLTNAFSKKLDNFKAAIALHFAYYNFVKIHSTLRTTPAMAAGIESSQWKLSDLVEMANA